MGMSAKAAPKAPYIHPQTFKSLECFNLDGGETEGQRDAHRALPWKQVVCFVLAVVSFKVFLFVQMGAEAYTSKVDELTQSSGLERIAGYAMQMDPATLWAIETVRANY